MVWSIFKHVKKALDEEDIEGLLAIGSPGDEYNGEASEIESLVAKKSAFGKRKVSARELEQTIRMIWEQQFGPLSEVQIKQRKQAFRRVAEKIQGHLYA
jgi:hypothetical protein